MYMLLVMEHIYSEKDGTDDELFIYLLYKSWN